MPVTRVTFAALYAAYAGRVIAALSFICAAAVFAYGVFLLLAVAHAAKLTAVQDQEATLATQVSQLESQYLAGSEALTETQAQQLGFVTPASVSIVYTQTESALTLNAR